MRDGDNFVLNGSKIWITNGDIADILTVFAVTDPALGARGGVTAFIVENTFPGFKVGTKETKMRCAQAFRMTWQRQSWASCGSETSSRREPQQPGEALTEVRPGAAPITLGSAGEHGPDARSAGKTAGERLCLFDIYYSTLMRPSTRPTTA